jgi:hypothetical protein
MTEHEKLLALRKKLVVKRRTLVASFSETPPEQITGESIARIQSAIDAVDRALEDEEQAAVLGKDIASTEDADASAGGSAVPIAFRPNKASPAAPSK